MYTAETQDVTTRTEKGFVLQKAEMTRAEIQEYGVPVNRLLTLKEFAHIVFDQTAEEIAKEKNQPLLWKIFINTVQFLVLGWFAFIFYSAIIYPICGLIYYNI